MYLICVGTGSVCEEITTNLVDIMAVKTVKKKMATESTPITAEMLDAALLRMTDSITELSKKMAETDAKRAETDAEYQRFLSDVNKRLKYLSADSGSHGQGLGRIVELIVVPGVRHAMNALGHHFKYAVADKKIKAIVKGEKLRVAEVDLFLHNGTEAMAVEIKTSLTPEDVNKHLDRLVKLRKYEKEANIQGKNLYGAVVGLFIDDNARRFALKNGLYVLEIMEDESSLKTDKPPKCRVW